MRACGLRLCFRLGGNLLAARVSGSPGWQASAVSLRSVAAGRVARPSPPCHSAAERRPRRHGAGSREQQERMGTARSPAQTPVGHPSPAAPASWNSGACHVRDSRPVKTPPAPAPWPDPRAQPAASQTAQAASRRSHATAAPLPRPGIAFSRRQPCSSARPRSCISGRWQPRISGLHSREFVFHHGSHLAGKDISPTRAPEP